MNFWKKKIYIKIAKDSKIVVECDWNITISQNFPFFPKNWWIFWKKMNILKIGKSSKVVTECDRISKSSQNFQNLIFSKKLDEVFQKKHEFLKIAKDSKIVVECDWKFGISQNVHFCLKRWRSFWKKWKS